jgi:nicotinate-nucleotide adenylyltransferase
LGHLVLAQEVYVQLRLDRVWFLPSGVPPHKTGKTISTREDRRAMVSLAIGDDDRFGLQTIELERSGPSYSADTLELLRERWGSEASIFFIMGWDMLASLESWHAPTRVLAGLDILVAVHRPGSTPETAHLADMMERLPGLREKLLILPAPQLDVAATALRARVASGLPVRYLVPDGVRDYIETHRLYQRLPGSVYDEEDQWMPHDNQESER